MQKQKKMNLAILFISIAGLVDAGYLSWAKFTDQTTRCYSGLGDCGSVTSSAYSLLFGIPVAYIGLLGYIIIFILAVLLLIRTDEKEMINYGLFGFSLFGFLFSAYLTITSIGILHSVCIYCLFSATCMTLLFVLSLYKIWNLLNN